MISPFLLSIGVFAFFVLPVCADDIQTPTVTNVYNWATTNRLLNKG